MPLLDNSEIGEIQEPESAQDPREVIGTGGPPVHEQANAISLTSTSSHPRQNTLPLTRAQKWATIMNARVDVFTYAAVLFFDPRAAAFSSLAMGHFGTITVAVSSVPTIARIVGEMAGK